MRNLCLSIASPKHRILEKPGAVWVLWGVGPAAVQRLDELDDPDDELVSEICRQAGDATILRVTLATGKANQIAVWKALTSCNEIFYTVRPGGDVFVSDQFRNILSLLPVADRYPSEQSIIDYFLFGTVPGTGSYAKGVARVGSGERLTIDLAAPEVKTSVFDEIGRSSPNGTVEAHIDDIDRALSAALTPLVGEPGTINLFSGGIDSTLIQSYLGPEFPAMNIVLESLARDAPYETTYASSAAKLLGMEPMNYQIREADYPAQIEAAIEDLGMPPVFPMIVVIRHAFLQDQETFVIGELADALFGNNGRVAKAASLLTSPLGLFLIRRIDRHLPRYVRAGLRELAPTAQALHEHPTSPVGYGLQHSANGEHAMLDAIFGQRDVRDRLVARLDFVLPRVSLSAPDNDRFCRHFEISQWIDFICGDHIMHMRQLANAHGKVLFTPFLNRAVFDSAVSTPVTKRYIRGFQAKYLLKLLLRRRVPDYPVNQRKGFAAVSAQRYLKSGPLANIWERYTMPDFIDRSLRPRLIDNPSQLTWHALGYAIWEDRVVKNAELTAAPDSSVLNWEI